MFGSAVLDTAIGLLLFFFTISTVCSNIYTVISNRLNTRGKLLNETLEKLLGSDYLNMVRENPIFKESRLKDKSPWNLRKFDLAYERVPDYFDPKKFAKVMVEICDHAVKASDYTRVLNSETTEIVGYFYKQVEQGQKTYDEIAQEITDWYNDTMYQLTEIYKQYTRVFIAVIAAVITIFFNLNTIVITDALWSNSTVRGVIVEAADVRATNIAITESQATITDENDNVTEIVEDEIGSLAALNFPVGWTPDELGTFGLPAELAMTQNRVGGSPNFLTIIVGWGLTIGAAMFGAPFWFRILQNLINIRNAGNDDDK